MEFLQAVLVQFGFTPFKMKKAELLATLNTFLIEQYAAGRKVLLIVDEAQNLPLRTLEEIRMLSGVETTKEKVLRIILAGQPDLNEKLDSPELIQLAQRVRLRFHLTALSERGPARLRAAPAGSGGFRWPQDIRRSRVPAAVPLCRRRAATGQHPVRDRDDGGVQCRPRPRPGRRRARGHRGTAVGGLRGTAGRTSRAGAPAADFTTTGRFDADSAGRPGGPPCTWAPATPITATPCRTFRWPGSSSQRKAAPWANCRCILGRTVVGRTPDNDLQIDNRFVSRHHCQILTSPDGCVIEDLNSTNGIVVKAKRVRHHNLNDGDVVTIGTHDLIYVDERAQHAAGPAHTETQKL